MAFLEKRGGLVPVYVFIFPVNQFARIARRFAVRIAGPKNGRPPRIVVSLFQSRKCAINQLHASITWCDLFRPNFGQKTPEIISVHDVWEPWKQVLLASRDVIISSQFTARIRRGFFTLGDGCWLPNNHRHRVNGVSRGGGQTVFNQILTRFHGIRLKSG